jgi:hypothetical protein
MDCACESISKSVAERVKGCLSLDFRKTSNEVQRHMQILSIEGAKTGSSDALQMPFDDDC